MDKKRQLSEGAISIQNLVENHFKNKWEYIICDEYLDISPDTGCLNIPQEVVLFYRIYAKQLMWKE